MNEAYVYRSRTILTVNKVNYTYDLETWSLKRQLTRCSDCLYHKYILSCTACICYSSICYTGKQIYLNNVKEHYRKKYSEESVLMKSCIHKLVEQIIGN